MFDKKYSLSDKKLIVKQITSTETLQIRHKVMWPSKPISFIMLPNDKNGRHFGLFVNDKIASVISIFEENDVFQFRKFATLKEYQGLGYGSLILKKIIAIIKKENATKLWCNARVEKIKFYENFGLKSTHKKFKKEEINYVILEQIYK